MTDLVVLMLTSMAMAWCADHVVWKRESVKKGHRMAVFSVAITVLMAGFAGLRTRCNDTGAYKHGYELITEGSLENIDINIGSNPLFNAINYWLKTNGVSTQNFLMFWAVVTVACYILFVHLYSSDYPLTIFLLFTTGCYTFVFAGIKQAAAIGIAALGTIFALKKKWLLFALCIVTASLIHPYALMYFAVPFMCFCPWKKNTYILLAAALCCGFLLRPFIGTIVNITTMIGEEYTVSSFIGDGVNIFRVLVCNVPLVLSWLYRKRLFANSTKEENLMINMTMLNGAIMFIGLFGTANYFGRLANYFLIFQSLSLPWMLKKIGGKDGKLLTALMVLGYIAYFYYANAINQPFDQDFARLSVREYIAQLGG